MERSFLTGGAGGVRILDFASAVTPQFSPLVAVAVTSPSCPLRETGSFLVLGLGLTSESALASDFSFFAAILDTFSSKNERRRDGYCARLMQQWLPQK